MREFSCFFPSLLSYTLFTQNTRENRKILLLFLKSHNLFCVIQFEFVELFGKKKSSRPIPLRGKSLLSFQLFNEAETPYFFLRGRRGFVLLFSVQRSTGKSSVPEARPKTAASTRPWGNSLPWFPSR